MNKGFKIIILLILAGLLLTACNGGSQTVTEDMDGQTISVKAGDSFIVKLAGNPTTGYTWQVAEQDGTIVKQDGDPDYKADSMMVGSGGIYTYHFKAVGSGTVTLKFDYLRTWENGVAPYKTFTITVKVK